MVNTRLQVTVLTLAAGALMPAPAVPQEPATAEREAFAAVVRAGEAVGRAPDGNALWRASGQTVAAAEHAADAFTEADRARDAALVAYRTAYREALAGAITCDNGYPCTSGRVDPFDGFSAAFAAHFELIAAVSTANAVYVDAVGIPGADAGRARAARIRGLAAGMRDLEAIDDPRRWNALVGSVGAEINAGNTLHRRATESRHAADRAFVDDVTRVMEALYAAANQVGPRGARAGAREVSDAVLRATLGNARDAMESLRSLLVAAASSEPDLVPGRSAENVAAARSAPDAVPGRSPETAPAGSVVPGGAEETARPGAATTRPGGNDAPGIDAEAAEPEPVDDLAGWAGALTAAARAAEQAAADAEAAAGGPGNSSSRGSSCLDAEARVAAAVSHVESVTVGDDRPPFVPARTGRETHSDLFHLLDAAKRRARAACRSIGR